MFRSLLLLAIAVIPALSADAQVGSSTLTLPEGWTAATAQDTTTLVAPHKTPHIQVRILAKPAPEVQAAVAALIVDQVKDFTVAKTETITLGKHAAVRLTGTGTEADDGDPSNVEITVMAMGASSVLVISHGEGKGTAERSAALAEILATLH